MSNPINRLSKKPSDIKSSSLTQLAAASSYQGTAHGVKRPAKLNSRITTGQFEEYSDKVIMEQTPAFVRQQSIQNIGSLGILKRQNLKERIIKNEDITAAKLRNSIRQASRESIKGDMKLQRMNSVINHYYEDTEQIENRFKKRLAKMTVTIAITPKLATKARAAAQNRAGIKFCVPSKATHTLINDLEPGWAGAAKHEFKFSFRGTRKSDVPHAPSIIEPKISTIVEERPNRFLIRSRPMSGSYQTLKKVDLNSHQSKNVQSETIVRLFTPQHSCRGASCKSCK